jgi:hypothetical protein
MKRIVLSVLALALTVSLTAKPTIGEKRIAPGLNKTAAGCNQTTATIDLDINNVRARIMTGGDAWWDRAAGAARYEVPKGGNANALFAGSIWIGGIDRSTQSLKVAAQTYRNRGNDYWTGPLDEFNGASVDFQTCSEWDRFWKVNRADINDFVDLAESCGNDPSCIFANEASIPDAIKEWPGRNANSATGSKTATGATGSLLNIPNREMAEFVDVDEDNVYNWLKGDYPKIKGDQYIWYVFNDKGDAKTQTQSDAIGVEIHLGAFAFATSDCLNDATFYNYRVHNWSTSIIDSTYMATWTDADLGNAFDDFIGCDTARGLGILYNGDGFDETPTGYGSDLPMVGVDFFQGPRIDNPNFPNSDPRPFIELKMSVFTYFTNGAGRSGDPTIGTEFYNYMTGSWSDGTSFKWGCDPLNGSGGDASSVYPDDPCKGGISEPDCNRVPDDRRFVHSAGPFQLIPGIVPSDIVIGAIWVPSVGGGKAACFSKILTCDDKSQALFDNDFELPFGPQAPDLNIHPLDRKLVIQLSNPEGSNNYNELYGFGTSAPDIDEPQYFESIPKAVKKNYPDSVYKFEGYIVYQLANANVSFSEIRSNDGSVNTDVARIVFQCDKDNHIDNLLNFEIDPEISDAYYKPKLMVSGANEGITHSLQITEDAFSTGTSKDLVNYKTYYYMAVAYAYNKFDNDDDDGSGATPASSENEFEATDADNTQDIQYIESRTDGQELPLRIIEATPHPAYDTMYVQNHAEYGTGIELTQVEGTGNGGRDMELTMESINEILYGGNNQDYNPTYQGNMGPMDIFVTTPDSLRVADYELSMEVRASHTGTSADLGAIGDSTNWILKDLTNGTTIARSDRSIAELNDQLLQSYGLSIAAEQVLRPGDNDTTGDNAFITSTITYADINLPWLSGIPDQEGSSMFNWIRAGEDFGASAPDAVQQGGGLSCDMADWAIPGDKVGRYEDIIGGTWGPYGLTVKEGKSECGNGVSYSRITDRIISRSIVNLQSVDIVFTSDKSLWSKCPVVEMTDHVGVVGFGQGGQAKYNIRKHPAWDKGSDGEGNPTYSTTESGYSWFPGYAINVETGERLNIFFGEESANGQDNGNDMIFNPTFRAVDPVNFSLKWGGKHLVYVMRTKYDEGAYAISKLRDADAETATKYGDNNLNMKEIYNNIMWVGNVLSTPFAPMTSIEDGLIPTETKIRIRVERPYANYLPDPNYTAVNNGWPLYTFSTKDLAPTAFGGDRNVYTGKADELLDNIQPVPNPYYSYSAYETGRLDNRIKIINLPVKATIKVYTIDGTLIRTLVKNDPSTTFIDWDLKNSQNIPIASGMYLIHVNVDGVGEKVLKWFGAMKPVDIVTQ